MLFMTTVLLGLIYMMWLGFGEPEPKDMMLNFGWIIALIAVTIYFDNFLSVLFIGVLYVAFYIYYYE